MKDRLRRGKTRPLGPIDELTEAEIDRSHRVVAMMGAEPYQKALTDGAQVVIAGRSSDAALFAAIPLMRGCDPGLAWHLAKIIECAAQVTDPRVGTACVIGTIRDDHSMVEPGHPAQRHTPTRPTERAAVRQRVCTFVLDTGAGDQ